MSFEEAVVAAINFHGALTGTGSYAPPQDARGGKHKGAGVGPSPAYSYSAQVAEVTVDEETGEVTVLKVWAAHDCGRALNPVSVEGQVIGPVWMGLGQALQEEMVWKDGLLINPGMLEYRSPSATESPKLKRSLWRASFRRPVWREGSERRFAGRGEFPRLRMRLKMRWECACANRRSLRNGACFRRCGQNAPMQRKWI